MRKSLSFQIRGTVQGVGFRPWVFRLAHQFHLNGFVRNTAQGVYMEIEGPENDVAGFVHQIRTEPPVNCVMTECIQMEMVNKGFDQFQIRSSKDEAHHSAIVLPDLATCPDCVKEIYDKDNRRYLYPFTNCTHCGPRYSIIESLPYDRKNTSMKKFVMCPACQNEYNDPADRRFHAQPNACPVCGPKVNLLDPEGEIIGTSLEALSAAADLIRRGAIVAVKAMGGFYLMADAHNDEAILLLRQRKARPHKPFALMMSSVQMAFQYCHITPLHAKLLQSPQSPIVLLQRSQTTLKVSKEVAPDNPYLGCMLPSMPLLHILMRMVNRPVIATSGNLSEEPICIDNVEAIQRLNGIADFFLVHDRTIVRHEDDSIVQVICGEVTIMRRARGYAPLPIEIGKNVDGLLATGAHQKNTIAIGIGNAVIISQHIGDLDNKVAALTFEDTISSLRLIYDAPITKVVCDAHPDYISSAYARTLNIDLMHVQHHYAHVASCMAEHDIKGDVLGVCWDGTGYGGDGTIWGGEFLVSDGKESHRFAHLDLFSLPGGDAAVKEPRRSALGLLYGLSEKGDWKEFKDLPSVKSFNEHELYILQRMIKQKVNSPMTSSMGRLFDGISSLLDLCHVSTFEGQAAMSLEYQISDKFILSPYYYEILPEDYKNKIRSIDWSGIVKGVIEDIRTKKSSSVISTRFHLTLIEIIVDMAHQVNKSHIVLTGGCFQNKWLLENAVNRLIKEGFMPYWNKKVPANDGGISLGQMFVAARK